MIWTILTIEKQSTHDEKAWGFWNELPKRERISLNRQYINVFGYDTGFPIDNPF